jgi:hypothetical protein
MKFSKFAQASILTEVFTKQDWDYFNAAYGIGFKPTPDGKDDSIAKAKKGRARAWIRDVLDVFAQSLDIEFGEAKMVFERPSMPALKRMYGRLADQAKSVIAEMDRLKLPTDHLDRKRVTTKYLELRKLADMDPSDLQNVVRTAWTRALSLPHPAFQRHLISGKSQVQQDAKSDVKVQGKRGSTPIVASKRPKAAKAA